MTNLTNFWLDILGKSNKDLNLNILRMGQKNPTPCYISLLSHLKLVRSNKNSICFLYKFKYRFLGFCRMQLFRKQKFFKNFWLISLQILQNWRTSQCVQTLNIPRKFISRTFKTSRIPTFLCLYWLQSTGYDVVRTPLAFLSSNSKFHTVNLALPNIFWKHFRVFTQAKLCIYFLNPYLYSHPTICRHFLQYLQPV